MELMSKVISRIERGNPIVVNFDVDEFSRIGSKAKAIGVTRYEGRWYVELEFKKWKGSSQSITLHEYMAKTKDIR